MRQLKPQGSQPSAVFGPYFQALKFNNFLVKQITTAVSVDISCPDPSNVAAVSLISRGAPILVQTSFEEFEATAFCILWLKGCLFGCHLETSLEGYS